MTPSWHWRRKVAEGLRNHHVMLPIFIALSASIVFACTFGGVRSASIAVLKSLTEEPPNVQWRTRTKNKQHSLVGLGKCEAEDTGLRIMVINATIPRQLLEPPLR